MSAVMKQVDHAPAMSEAALVEVLSGSLYPGAAHNSVVMVLAYCQAAHLDPMLKPVHIVPVYQKGRGMVDVVMPGIGLYRIQAARTGQYAGISDPEFGPSITTKLAGVEVTYPEWCRVTVKRQMSNGLVAEFTASERWLENYATSSKDTIAPNAMWKRRAFAQLAKCAEAQALRKAFPEIGSEPTADEMMGKTINEFAEEARTALQATPAPRPALEFYPADRFEANLPKWRAMVESGEKTPEVIEATVSTRAQLTEEQREAIHALASEHHVIEGDQA